MSLLLFLNELKYFFKIFHFNFNSSDTTHNPKLFGVLNND